MRHLAILSRAVSAMTAMAISQEHTQFSLKSVLLMSIRSGGRARFGETLVNSMGAGSRIGIRPHFFCTARDSPVQRIQNAFGVQSSLIRRMVNCQDAPNQKILSTIQQQVKRAVNYKAEPHKAVELRARRGEGAGGSGGERKFIFFVSPRAQQQSPPI